MEYKGMKEDERLISVTPSKRQIAYQNTEYFCFIHFTVNTFTGSEWGLGDEPESIFNPEELDDRQWAKTAAEGGMKGLILTCKHHDGFCLWPGKYTEHSMKNSPYKNGKGDIVRETAEACKEYGLKFGVYLSPFLIIVEQISHHRHSVLGRQTGNLLFHAFLIQHLKLKMLCIMRNYHQQEEQFYAYTEQSEESEVSTAGGVFGR